MSSAEPEFSHFANTRPHHRRWTIIGVADSIDDPVRSVEIFQGPDRDEPRLVLAPDEIPQFVAGLIATIAPGDLTSEEEG
jgi:hypothetical protein